MRVAAELLRLLRPALYGASSGGARRDARCAPAASAAPTPHGAPHPRAQDSFGLLLLFAVAFGALIMGYSKAEPLARARAQKAHKDKEVDVASEATWFALFQVNFLFFVVFGLAAAVILPQFEKDFDSAAYFGASYGLFHAAGSILPAAAIVALKQRTGLF